VGRSFAGVLGLVAFVAAMARGWVAGGDVNHVVFDAWLGLILFAAVGYVAGSLAGWIVDDSVRSRVAMELAARQTETAASTNGDDG